jgi:hypothetical protein
MRSGIACRLTIFLAAILWLDSGCSRKEDKPAAPSPEPPVTTAATEPPATTEPEAPPVIEPGSGVGKVRRGMTVDQVIAGLGPPKSTNGNMLVYPRLGIWVGMNKETGDIFNMHLRRGFDGRTPEGVGVGSSRAEVIAAYGEPSSDQRPKPRFEILHYNKPVIRFFLQSDVVDYIVLDLPKAR